MDIRERMAYFRRLYEEIHAEDLQRQAKARALSRRLYPPAAPRGEPGTNKDYEYQRQYREAHRDDLKAYRKKYYKNNKR